MNNKSFYMKVISIAVPIALQQLIISSLNLIDTFMISSLSKEAIAGVGAANRIFFLLNLMLFGISNGASILAAQFWGAKDTSSIKKVYGIALTFAMMGSLMFTIVSVVFPEAVLSLFTNDKTVILKGSQYLQIVAFSYVFTGISFTTSFILRSTNNVKVPLTITLIAIVTNTFLNYAMIFGHFGFQARGVEGAAIATLFARGLEVVLYISIVNIKDLPPAGSPAKLFAFTKVLMNKFMKIAVPVVIHEILWSTGVTMYAVAYGRISTEAMATMTITQTIEQIAFVAFIGLGNACGIILGNDLGAGGKEEVFKDARRFVKLSIATGIIIGVLVAIGAPFVSQIYNVDAVIKKNITYTLWVFALFLTFKSINLTVMVGILRSGGDTTYTAVLDAIGVWLVGVPGAFITGLILNWSLPLVYCAVMMEEIIKLPFAVMRMHSKKWLNNLVEE